MLVAWPTLYLLLIGTWQARFVRHTLPLAPFCCLFAAGSVMALYRRLASDGVRPQVGRWIGRAVGIVVVGGALLWGAAFLSIYVARDTRLAATDWIYQNVAKGSVLVIEDKNQLLPMPGIGEKSGMGVGSQYKYNVLQVTEQDSAQKMDDFAAKLAAGDLLVVPNRRWSAVLPLLPEFALTGGYYKLLESGQLGYTPVATFASPPRLGPLVWPDDSAEETFQVFDHPTVRLYRNEKRLNVGTLRVLLHGQ